MGLPGYSGRVAARTALGRELLKPENEERRRAAGLVDDELTTIVTRGEDAERFDRQQRADLAAQRFAVTTAKESREEIDSDEEHLRNRLPAVVLTLGKAAETRDAAIWLARSVFERFQMRVTLPKQAEGEPAPEVPPQPEKTRVVNRTRLARAQALMQLVDAILEPGRETIVNELARRRMDRERLVELARDARAIVDAVGGKLTMSASDATQLEADAVTAQKETWDACRKMIRAAVEGSTTLMELWAKC